MYRDEGFGRRFGLFAASAVGMAAQGCLAVASLGFVFMSSKAAAAPPLAPVFHDPLVFPTMPGGGPSGPYGLAVVDLVGGDGLPDVAVVNNIGTLSIFRNTGNWDPNEPGDRLVHVPESPLLLSGIPWDVEAADMDKDGNLDLVVSYGAGDFRVQIVRFNSTTGQFELETPIELTGNVNNTAGLEVADLDQDGRMDIVVACEASYGQGASKPRLQICWQESPGAFLQDEYEIGNITGAGTDIALGKLQYATPAGRLDIVMTMGNGLSGSLVLLNEGNRQFNVNPPPGFEPYQSVVVSSPAAALGKFRADPNTVDLVCSQTLAFNGWVYYSRQTDLVFDPDPNNHLVYPLQGSSQPFGIDVGRINPDTKNDIVFALQRGDPCGGTHGGIAIAVGNGDGTFVHPPYKFCVDNTPGATPKPCFVKIADMNQDGLNDIVTSNNVGHSISVLINKYLITIPPQ